MGEEPIPSPSNAVFSEAKREPPSDLSEQIVMQVVAGPQTGVQFTFDKHDLFLVGRSMRAHLQLAGDPHFSRFHFRLEVNPPECYLIDLGSRNGTFVNGKRAEGVVPLREGDVVRIGTVELIFRGDAAAREAGSVPVAPVAKVANVAPPAAPAAPAEAPAEPEKKYDLRPRRRRNW